MGWKALLTVTAGAMSIAASLPQQGPTPHIKPAENQQQLKPESSNTPLPDPKPEPQEKTEPETRPTTDETTKPGSPAESEVRKPELPEPPLTIEPESEADLKACMADLSAIGARFETVDRIDDDKGCGIDKPIRIDRLLPGVALSPAGDMRCETALQLARWVQHSVIPAATVGLPGEGRLTSVNQASSYVCRKRNGATTGKISEHARGNAVDIASLSLGRKTVPMRIVKPEDSTIEDAFQRAINATACLFFKTVLSPGSDAAHQDHMHMDVLERRGGYRYCR